MKTNQICFREEGAELVGDKRRERVTQSAVNDKSLYLSPFKTASGLREETRRTEKSFQRK
jgi:hypothetical protein